MLEMLVTAMHVSPHELIEVSREQGATGATLALQRPVALYFQFILR